MFSNERKFWTVGFSEWGRWQVRSIDADNVESGPPYTYKLEEDLGPELIAAYLEADGDFVYLPGLQNISLITEDKPWLFVITTNGNLYVKRAGVQVDMRTAIEDGTVILLDTGVKQASVCRGWCSEQYDVDSGLIVAYRKQTGAYYRVYKKISGVYTWDSVETLTSQSVNHVEVKRLNDYRIGFVLDNQLMLSGRFYIGGTSKTEFVDVTFDSDFRVWAVFNLEEGPYNEFTITSVELSQNGEEFSVSANYPFYYRDPTWNDISITSSIPSSQGIDSYRIEDGKLKIRLLQALTSSYASMTFKIRSLNRILFKRNNNDIPNVPETTISYTPPDFRQKEEIIDIDSIQSSISLSIKPLEYISHNQEENISVSVSAAVALDIKPINYINQPQEESIFISQIVSSAALTVVQSGDVPI